MSTASLTVLADTRKFQAELAKIPGYTEKSAAKAALKMAMEYEKGQQKAAEAAARAAKKAGDAWDVAIKVKVVDAIANAGMKVASSFGSWAVAGVSAADSMGDLSQESGVAVETLLAIKDAATKAGEEFEPLQQSFAGMAKKIYDFASTGGGKAADVFRDLGVQVKNADGSLRSVNEIAVDTISRMQEMGDKTQQAALATKLLGDSGQEMLRVLGDTSISDWAGSMSTAADDVARTNEGLDALNLALGQMKDTAGSAGSALVAAFGADIAIAIGALTGSVSSLVADFTLLKDLIAGGGGPEANGKAWSDWSARLEDIRIRYEQLKQSINAIGQAPAISNDDMAAALGMPTSTSAPTSKPAAAPKPARNTGSNRPAAPTGPSASEIAAQEEAKRQAESLALWQSDIDAKIEASNRYMEEMQALHDQEAQWAEEEKARLEELAAARAQYNQQLVQGAMNVAASLFDVYAQSLQAEVDATKEGTNAHKVALRKQWEAQHAAAEASALVNIAMATSQSLASAPYPANIALAALSAIAAGAAFAKVASAKPPSFHVGSMGNRADNRQSDEYAATLKRNEVVVPAPTVAANGGPSGVERALSGGGTTYIAVSIDGKDLDAAVDRRLAARGIPPRGHKFRAVQ